MIMYWNFIAADFTMGRLNWVQINASIYLQKYECPTIITGKKYWSSKIKFKCHPPV